MKTVSDMLKDSVARVKEDVQSRTKTGPQMMLEQMMKSIGFEPEKIKASLVEAKDAIQSQVDTMVRDIELNRELITMETALLNAKLDGVIEMIRRIELKLDTIPVSELVKIPRPTDEEIARALGTNEFGFASDSSIKSKPIIHTRFTTNYDTIHVGVTDINPTIAVGPEIIDGNNGNSNSGSSK